MLTVYRYPVPIKDKFEITMPAPGRILTVQVQKEKPQIWALVDPEVKGTVTHKFRLVGTSHPISEDNRNLKYINTFQIAEDGRLVFHLFEII